MCTADGAYTWTTRNADGDTLRYRTNAEGDGVFYESASFFNQDGWDQIMKPSEFAVRDCSPSTRRRRIVAFLTNEGFQVTTGQVVPAAPHDSGYGSLEPDKRALDQIARRLLIGLDRRDATGTAHPESAQITDEEEDYPTLTLTAVMTDWDMSDEDDTSREFHTITLDGHEIGARINVEPFDLFGHLRAELLTRGIEWDPDQGGFDHPDDAPLDTAFSAAVCAPVNRARLTATVSTIRTDDSTGCYFHWVLKGRDGTPDRTFTTGLGGQGLWEGTPEWVGSRTQADAYFDVSGYYCPPSARRAHIVAYHSR